jgi:signal transduction histidine kinase
MRRQPKTLARILTLKLVLVTGLVSLLLLIFFFVKYMLDTPALRRGTLAIEEARIVEALSREQDPSHWPLYRAFPKSYAFRVLEERGNESLRLVAEANPELLPTLSPAAEPLAKTLPPGMAAGFQQLARPNDQPGRDRWLLTGRNKAGQRSYWVQVAMAGDPAWRWRLAIADEMLDHVIVPVLSIVPPLTLAIVLTTRRALRPLARIGLQAEALGKAVRAGRTLAPLPQDHLPLEFSRVVSAINVMLISLERSLEQQKRFTSDAAHELRTPLSVLLLEIAELPSGPVVERLRSEVQDLAALVNQLLRLAQAEDLMLREREVLDIVELARQICEDMAGAALERRLTLEFVAAARVPIRGNAALLDIALRNIIDNAIKWSAPGTAVTIMVDPARVIVEDRGPGVEDQYKERIFDRFWRADHQQTGGTGIGLALVRRIAQLHGGEVRVEDREGGGARFVFTLPPAGADAAEP